MEEIASGHGDLTQRLPVHGRDESAAVAEQFNAFAEKIQVILLDVRRSSEAVNHAANEITQGGHDLSRRTEQAAASLQQTSSAMEEISSTVSHTTDDLSSAPIPNMHRAIIRKKPVAPPMMVNSVLRLPCMAPWVSANRPFGPGESDRPMQAIRYKSHVSNNMLMPHPWKMRTLCQHVTVVWRFPSVNAPTIKKPPGRIPRRRSASYFINTFARRSCGPVPGHLPGCGWRPSRTAFHCRQVLR